MKWQMLVQQYMLQFVALTEKHMEMIVKQE